MWRSLQRLAVVAGFVCALVSQSYAATVLGKTVFVRGVATAQSATGEGRILGKDSPLFEGDVITTGKKTFAILNLEDGTRMTLKPNSVFKLEGYKATASASATKSQQASKESKSEGLFLRLFRGGLRTITGLLGKRDKGFQIATPIATIGVRGTDFEARLCEDDCQDEAKSIRRTRTSPESLVVARVAFLTGTLTATGFDGQLRQMSLGGSLLAGDTLETAASSVTVIVFRDESRITLRANTRFRIDSHNYKPTTPEENSTIMRLLRGSIRVISGLIAKSKPSSHKVVTPVATMSARGTGFDIICRGELKNAQAAKRQQETVAFAMSGLLGHVIRSANAQEKDGCDVWVWDGIVVLQYGSKTVEIPQGTAYFYDGTGDPIPYREVPPIFRNQESPEPAPGVMGQIAFDATAQDQPEFGLYVEVSSGDVLVTNLAGHSRVAGHGEVLYVDVQGGDVQQLSTRPRLIGIPDPALFDDSVTQEIMILNPEADVPQSRFECLIG